MVNADHGLEFVYDRALGCWGHESSKHLLGPVENEEPESEVRENADIVNDEERDVVEVDDANEGVVIKTLRRPEEPTKQEVEEHESSHIPYRKWCPSCVSGRGRSLQHSKVSDKEEEDTDVPTVAMDYGYLNEEGKSEEEAERDGSFPMLVVKDTKTRWKSADILISEGTAHPWSTKALTKKLDGYAYPRVSLKSDGEHALVALKHTVGKKLASA